MQSVLHAPTPIPSLLLGAAGGALVGGRPRRPVVGTLVTLAGLALVGVAAGGAVGEALRRAGGRRRDAHLRLSLVVPHPVPLVFRFCSNFENFPTFIRALREVQDFGDGRSHWSARSRGHQALEWDAVTTKFVTNRVIAWQSTPESLVRMSCTLRFVPERGGATCVKVAIDYALPTERIKDAVSALAKRRRTRELEEDIRRIGERLDRFAATVELPS
ncbi:MAG TPA: SRPBCC family protein [Gemmatimonadaceae bacterium]|nr:SRPBCC family protein [Gemmatimonadaceae bacterium]